MKTYYFHRIWETEFITEVEAESLEEAIKIVQDDNEPDWDCDHGNDICTSTYVDDEDDIIADLDYDFNIKKQYRDDKDE